MTKKIKIQNMQCVSCKEAIEYHFKKLNIKVKIYYIEEYGIFEWDENQWQIEDIFNNIIYLGYKPFIGEKYVLTKKDYLEKVELVIALVISALFLTLMWSHVGLYKIPFFDIMNNGYLQFIFASFIQFFVGRKIYLNAYHNLINKVMGMDFLIVFSTSFAYFYSVFLLITKGPILPHKEIFFFETSVIVITFSLIGRMIESKLRKKAKLQLQSAFTIQKKFTLVNGKVKKDSEVLVGEKVLIKTGQKITFDAKIIKGKAVLDLSSLNGEAHPQLKKVGDKIISGTINVGKTLEVEVLENPIKSKYNLILESIKNLETKKSSLTKRVDTISYYFTPLVILIIILNFLTWTFIKGDINSGIYFSIAIAVVACPCALGLATPMSIIFGATKAIEEKILYNNGSVFEKISKIDVLAFDKTGTITRGEMEIKKIIGDKTHIEHFISLEIISMHPIAKAFMSEKEKLEKDFNIYKFTHYEEIIGEGVKGEYKGDHFEIGSYKFITKDNSISNELKAEYDNLKTTNFIVVIGAINKKVTTIFCLKDQIRNSAYDEILKMKNQGIKPIMITGDNELNAMDVAKKVGITEVYFNTNPEDKLKIIKKLQKRGNVVGFVGDGVNDAKALIQANLSIAMGSGADASTSIADVVLLDSNITNIHKTLFISNKTLSNIKQNLILAFSWNGIMIPIAAIGLLAPWVGALAMSVESIIIISNSSRLSLLNFKNKKNK